MPVAVWTVDRSLRFTMSEGGGLASLGIEPRESVGRTLYEFFGTDDPTFPPIAAHVRALDGEAVTQELSWMDRAFDARVQPLRNSNGEVVGVIGFAIDATDRARVEAALRGSEEQPQALADSARDLIIRYRVLPSRRFEYVSPSATEISGYTPEEFYADPDLGAKAIHPDDRASYEALAQAPGTCDEPVVLRWFRKDGRLISVEQHSVPVRNENGAVTDVHTIARDVTEWERTEEDLRRRDAILGALTFIAERLLVSPSWQESMKNVLARLGRAARVSRAYVFENSTAPDGTLLMSRRFEWVAEGVAPQLANPALQDLAWEQGPFARWMGVLRRDGIVWGLVTELPQQEASALAAQDVCSIVAVPVFAGETWWGFLGFDQCDSEREFSRSEIDAFRAVAGTLGAAIQRRRAEELLRESDARYRTLVEHLPTIIYIAGFGPSGQWLYVSPKIQEVLGYSPEEWMSEPSPLVSRLHPDDRERVLAEEAACQAKGDPFRCEYRVLDREGRVVWLRDEAVPMASAPELWQGVMLDVTERRQSEEMLQRTVAVLRETDDERRRLLARLVEAREEEHRQIAAEVNDGPIEKMFAVGLRLEVLRRRAQDPETLKAIDELTQVVEGTTRELRSLLFELVPPALQRSRLADALRAMLFDVADDSVPQIRLEDRLDVEPMEPARTTCFRIAREAVRNVVKHAAASSLELALETAEGGTRVTIKDDGCGFEPSEAAIDEHFGLTGMRERAEAAGGRLRIDSTPGEGTSVEFWLPDPELSSARTPLRAGRESNPQPSDP
ncbi:MAG: PAS domain-containing protein [Actinomycetota bacterium]